GALPLDVLEDQVVAALVLADHVDLDNVGVAELGDVLRFDLEAFQRGGMRGEILAQQLEGDLSPERDLLREVDLSHASLPQSAQNAEIAERLPGEVGACRGRGRRTRRLGCGTHGESPPNANLSVQEHST